MRKHDKKISGSALVAAAGLLLAVAPGAGRAEEPPAVRTRAAEASSDLLTPFGEYFLVGGGVTNFLDAAVKDRVEVGGTWDLRLGFGSRFYVGAEAAYVGAARKAESLGSNLVSNGAEGIIRVQYPYVAGDWLVEPFGFGGAGWTHLVIHDMARGVPGLEESDDVFVLPVGGGITLAYRHFLFDARYTYRQSFDETLVKNADGSPASLKNWAVTGSLGYEF